MVLSTDKVSTLMRMISSSCNALKTRSKTPALAHRFIRV